jgi:hypothetical protein
MDTAVLPAASSSGIKQCSHVTCRCELVVLMSVAELAGISVVRSVYLAACMYQHAHKEHHIAAQFCRTIRSHLRSQVRAISVAPVISTSRTVCLHSASSIVSCCVCTSTSDCGIAVSISCRALPQSAITCGKRWALNVTRNQCPINSDRQWVLLNV